MCGIIGMVAQRDSYGVLIEGLRRLEYRGYDSAGVALVDDNQQLHVRKTQGKVRDLDALVTSDLIEGQVGIAHTRWATHGVPNTLNSHPHTSGGIAVAHNGIVENHQTLRSELIALGYIFVSETDTEVIAHLIHKYSKSNDNLLTAVQEAVKQLEGAYALVVVSETHPLSLIGVRSGSPLILGVGVGEYYLASDQLALRQVTDRFIFLEEGDSIECRADGISIFNANGSVVQRHQEQMGDKDAVPSKGDYRHFMQKEIFEQPHIIGDSLTRFLDPINKKINIPDLKINWKKIKKVNLIACGTSFYACQVATYWIEKYVNISANAYLASEYRYKPYIKSSLETLEIFISQSGETADTLAALKFAKKNKSKTLSLVNVNESSISRESDYSLSIAAGPEIGVASTKAFSAQLCVLGCLCLVMARNKKKITKVEEFTLTESLLELPSSILSVLDNSEKIKLAVKNFVNAKSALFLGRGSSFPIAMEGALKLKEISYIHAEGYASGEMKHGPIALVDDKVPVVVIAPKDFLFKKNISNMQEIMARGGKELLITDENGDKNTKEIKKTPHSINWVRGFKEKFKYF